MAEPAEPIPLRAIRLWTVLLLVSGAVLGQDTGTGRGTLESVGEPVLEIFEQGVQEQLRGARQQVAGILESSEDREERGDALGQLGALYLLYDFMEIAEQCLVQARRLQPQDFRWPYFLAVVYEFEGKPEKGLEGALAAARLNPDYAPAFLRAGELQLQKGELDAAEASYRKALEVVPGSSTARYGLGRAALERGQLESAIELLSEAIPGQPPGTVVHYHLGMAYRDAGDRERAREELRKNKRERIVFHDPLYDTLASLNRSREAIFDSGVAALRRGEPELALQAFREVIEAHPEDAEAHYNVGMALIELDRKAEAEQFVRKALEYRDDYRDAHFNLGLMMGQRGDHVGSVRHFERAVEIDPEDQRARVRLANARASLGQYDRALALLEQVLAIDPAMADARLALGVLQARSGDGEAAVETLAGILELAPGAAEERSEAHLQLAMLGSPDVAPAAVIEHLQHALELDPDYLEARSALARELARQQRFDDAAVQFELLLEARPRDPELHFGRAMAYLLGDACADARRTLEESVRQLAAVVALQHALARLLATCPDDSVRDGGRALQLAREVVQRQLTLEHGETLAMAYAELGRFEEAVQIQQQVLDRELSTQGVVEPARLERMRLYQQGQPVRAPWKSGS